MSTEQHIDPEVTYIARCPEHGLHGERTECFVCEGPVEQVPMVELAQADPIMYLGKIDAREYEEHLRSPEVQATLASAKGVDPEGQEYAYRIRWGQEPFFSDRTGPHKCVHLCVTSDEASSLKRDFDAAGWKPVVERALLGTWERV